MEAAGLSETPVNFYHTERRHIPEDSNLRRHRHVILQFRLTNYCVGAAGFLDDDTSVLSYAFAGFKLHFRKHKNDAERKANSIQHLHDL
jgi:hypothetical protein